MPQLDPLVVGFLAIVAGIGIQAVKGLLSNKAKDRIPIASIGILSLAGAGLALYSGRDPMAGIFEGFFAAASATGLYEGLASLPGVSRVINSAGWLSRS